MLKQREKFSNSEIEAIAKSSRPEVAASLYSYGEPQALFVGSLNKNSIRAIWVKEEGRLKRLSPKEYMNLYVNGSGKKKKLRMFNPRDVVSLNDVLVRYKEAYPHLGKDEILDIIGENPHYLKNVLMTDTQWNDVVRDLEKLGFRVDGGSQIGWG